MSDVVKTPKVSGRRNGKMLFTARTIAERCGLPVDVCRSLLDARWTYTETLNEPDRWLSPIASARRAKQPVSFAEFTELVTEARNKNNFWKSNGFKESLAIRLADAVEVLQTQLAAEAENRRTLAGQYYASAVGLQSRLEKAETALNDIEKISHGDIKDARDPIPPYWRWQIRDVLAAYRRSEGNN